MGTPLRNTLHERYAQERAKGLTQMQAAQLAGFSTKSSANMSRVDRRQEVQDRITEIQREKRERLDGARAAEVQALTDETNDAEINVAWLVKEAVLVLREAQDRGDAKGALDAIKTIAQLKGILRSPGVDNPKGKPPAGDSDDPPNLPRTLNLQILNQVLGGVGDGSRDGRAPEQAALTAGEQHALPALRDDGPLAAVRMLDGLAGDCAPTVPGAPEDGSA